VAISAEPSIYLVSTLSVLKNGLHQEFQSHFIAFLFLVADVARGSAIAAADDLAGSLVAAVDEDVSQAFDKQRQIGHTLREVRLLAAKLGKQCSQWTSAVQTVDKALRDFGDFEQHLGVIQADMEELGALLKAAVRQKAEKAARTSSSGPSTT
jgi:septal ring factor EnvC (AmiA/AmiB activator)